VRGTGIWMVGLLAYRRVKIKVGFIYVYYPFSYLSAICKLLWVYVHRCGRASHERYRWIMSGVLSYRFYSPQQPTHLHFVSILISFGAEPQSIFTLILCNYNVIPPWGSKFCLDRISPGVGAVVLHKCQLHRGHATIFRDVRC